MPISFDENKNDFKFYGQFCSWECMKSYNLYSNSSFKQSIFNYIQMCHDRLCSGSQNIKFAPPKTMLNVFGGEITIEDFRSNNSEFKVYEHPVQTEEQIVEKYENFSIKSKSENFTPSEDTVIVNEPIKLKRKTPKPSSQNTLEKSMGLWKK